MPHPFEQLDILSKPIEGLANDNPVLPAVANYLRAFHSRSPVSGVPMSISLITQYGHESKLVDFLNFLSDRDELMNLDLKSTEWANKFNEFRNKYIAETGKPVPYEVNISGENRKELITKMELNHRQNVMDILATITIHLLMTANREIATSGIPILKKINSVAKYFKDFYYVATTSDKRSAENYLQALKFDNDLEVNGDKKRILIEMVLQRAMEEKQPLEIITAILQLNSTFEKDVRNTVLTDFYAHAVEMGLQTKQPKEVMMKILNLANKNLENLGGEISSASLFMNLIQEKLPAGFIEEVDKKNQEEIEKNKLETVNLLRSIQKFEDVLGPKRFSDFYARLKPLASRENQKNYEVNANALRQLNAELKEIIAPQSLINHLKKQMEILDHRILALRSGIENSIGTKQESEYGKYPIMLQNAELIISRIKAQLKNPQTDDAYLQWIKSLNEQAKDLGMAHLNEQAQELDIEKKQRPMLFHRIAATLKIPGFSQYKSSAAKEKQNNQSEDGFVDNIRKK